MSTIKLDHLLDQPGEIDTHQPQHDGRRLRPSRVFLVVQSGRVVDVHQGFGLSLMTVLAHIAGVVADPLSGPLLEPYDVAVFKGDRLRAVVHAPKGGQTCVITRFGADGRPLSE